MGNESQDTDAEYARAFTGAMYIAETMHDVKNILRALTKKD